jgi:hypothetical protein
MKNLVPYELLTFEVFEIAVWGCSVEKKLKLISSLKFINLNYFGARNIYTKTNFLKV